MTVPITLLSDIQPRVQFTANGTQTAFPASFPIRTTDELIVQFDDGETPDIAYSVVQPDDDDGFTVTFASPPSDGTRITILRSGTIEFQTPFNQEQRLSAATMNATLVNFSMRLQELRTLLQRTFRLPDSDPVSSLIVPTVAERANKFAYFDATGELTALASAFDAVLDFAAYPDSTPELTDTMLINRPGDPAATLVRRTTLAELAGLLATSAKPFRTVDDVGMAGNGTTDDSYALQADMDVQGPLGGATYFLRAAAAGGSFYFGSTPRVPSNTSVFLFSPILLAKAAGLNIQGEFAAVTGRDAFKLVIDSTEGAFTSVIDTAPHGGGVLSTLWAVGDFAETTGLRDGCATPLESQVQRVTAIDDDAATLTFATANAYAFEVSYDADDYEINYGTANQTVIRKLVTSLATADLSIGNNLVTIPVDDIGKFTVGDLVMIADEMTSDMQSGASGSGSVLINQEMRCIAASVSGDAANSHRLDGRVDHDFTAANSLRLVKVTPVVGALISGARALFAEAPDATPVRHVFVQRLARRSAVAATDIPNTDNYGRRGTAFRFDSCYECGFEDVSAKDAKYYAPGEGYGVDFNKSVNCWVRGGIFNGMRHPIIYQGSTNCHDHDVQAAGSRSTAIDFHGQGEVGCVSYSPTLDGATNAESAPGRASYAVSFGNTAWLGGTRKCGVIGGRISNFSSDTGSTLPSVRLVPGYRDCFVKGTEFSNVSQLLGAEDVTSYGTVTGSGFRMEGVSVDGVALAKMIDIHGRRNGASVNTIRDIKISLTARNIKGGASVLYVTELEFVNNFWDEVTPDVSFTYVLDLESITDCKILRNDFSSFSRGVRLTSVTGLEGHNNHFADQSNTTVFNDTGSGNTGSWFFQTNSAFTPLFQSSNSLIAFTPRLPGVVDMTDDTALKVKPSVTRGRAFFSSTSGTSFIAQFSYYTATPSIDVGGATSPIVDFTTGALTGTTGTDGKITISVHTDGTLQIENRTGSTLRVEGELS